MSRADSLQRVPSAQPEPRRYGRAVDQLSAAQKSGAGVPAYLRWVNRGIGRRAAAVAFVIGLSPNAVTLLSVVSSLAGMSVILLSPSHWSTAVLASFLLLAGYALDSADGQLARLQGTGSLAGEWLDHVVDAARLPLFHLVIAAYFFREDMSIWLISSALVFSLITSVWFFSQTLAGKLSVAEATHSSAPAWVSFVKLPYDVGILYLAVVALAFTNIFMALYMTLFAVNVLVAAASMIRKYRSLEVEPDRDAGTNSPGSA